MPVSTTVSSSMAGDLASAYDPVRRLRRSHSIEGYFDDINDQLIKEQPVLKVYKRRWYILGMFSALAFLSGAYGSCFQVIATSVRAAYKWSTSDFSFLATWNFSMYAIGIVPMTWLANNKGVRVSVVLTAFLVLISVACRCVPSSPPAVTVLAHLSYVFNGLAGVILFSGGSMVSATWFPPNERATATSLATMAFLMGPACMSIVGSKAVQAPMTSWMNTTDRFTVSPIVDQSESHKNYTNIPEIQSDILRLAYIECGITAVVFLATLIYFPSHPPEAPSISAVMDKVDYKTGMRELFRKESSMFWVISVARVAAAGANNVWTSLMVIILRPIGVSQAMANWISVCAAMTASVFGIMFGKVADVWNTKRKTLLTVILLIGATSGVWLLLLVRGYVSWSLASLFVATSILVTCSAGPMPIYMEMAVEAVYPIPEIISVSVQTVLYVAGPICLYGVMMIPHIGTVWLDWAQFVFMVAAVPLVLVFRESNKRLSLDTQSDSPTIDPAISNPHLQTV